MDYLKLVRGALASSTEPRTAHAPDAGGAKEAKEAKEAADVAKVTSTGRAPLAAIHAGLTAAEQAGLRAEAPSGDRLAELVLAAVACTPEPSAWRLYARRLDRELWLARDLKAAVQLDRNGARAGLPVVLALDLERLRGFDDRRLNDLLDALAVFPGARLGDLEPDQGAA